MNAMSDLERKICDAAVRLGDAARQRNHRIVTAESCTGGAIAAAVTEVPGSSEWFEEGFVTYAVHAKTHTLDVREDLIECCGVVSEPVAQAMARAALAKSTNATVSVAVTGVAGPGGGTPEVPVGTVAVGWAERFNGHIVSCSRTLHIPGSRHIVRRQTVLTALLGLTELMQFGNPSVMPCEY